MDKNEIEAAAAELGRKISKNPLILFLTAGMVLLVLDLAVTWFG